jgi:O-methyltransferase involved in polyketide biosynthesis
MTQGDERAAMSETKSQVLSGVTETSLIALYIRALESHRPGGLIKDEKAVALVAQMSDEYQLGNAVAKS